MTVCLFGEHPDHLAIPDDTGTDVTSDPYMGLWKAEMTAINATRRHFKWTEFGFSSRISLLCLALRTKELETIWPARSQNNGLGWDITAYPWDGVSVG